MYVNQTAKIAKKIFSEDHIRDCEAIKIKYSDKYKLTPINNICLIFEKLKSSTKGDYVECGTFQGKTLIPTAMYCKDNNIMQDRQLFGFDTFEGFPTSDIHPNDHPSMFTQLFNERCIDVNHYKKAKIRTDFFRSVEHLHSPYFNNPGNILNTSKNFSNVKLIKGLFSDTTPTFTNDICVLYIDADLYESYLECLINLYDNVISGGAVIFDEYYSCKYPGARIAVDEFFADKEGVFEVYVTSEGHERWCWIKE